MRNHATARGLGKKGQDLELYAIGVFVSPDSLSWPPALPADPTFVPSRWWSSVSQQTWRANRRDCAWLQPDRQTADRDRFATFE